MKKFILSVVCTMAIVFGTISCTNRATTAEADSATTDSVEMVDSVAVDSATVDTTVE